jgi:type IV pilus assembly protein PilC
MEKNTMRNPLFADFPEQMAQVLAAGMTPEEGIRILRKDAERKEDQEAIDRMLAVLEDHGELSDAMKASNAFSDRMIRFVSMGEKTGHLESVLRRLQEDGEREYALRRSVKNAIFYPFLITSVMIVILALILIFVMPVFRSAYSGLGMEMTGLQRVLLNLGIFLGRYGL